MINYEFDMRDENGTVTTTDLRDLSADELYELRTEAGQSGDSDAVESIDSILAAR